MTPQFVYAATVVKVHDADTATFSIDLGFDVHVIHPLRFAGLNAPELATKAGQDALAYLLTLLKPGDPVVIQTTKGQWDKYGRYLGTIWIAGQAPSINEQLIASGHAVAWNGKGPKP